MFAVQYHHMKLLESLQRTKKGKKKTKYKTFKSQLRLQIIILTVFKELTKD